MTCQSCRSKETTNVGHVLVKIKAQLARYRTEIMRTSGKKRKPRGDSRIDEVENNKKSRPGTMANNPFEPSRQHTGDDRKACLNQFPPRAEEKSFTH